MTIPATFDMTPQYLAVMPQRLGGDPCGDCDEASMCYAMEMRAIVQWMAAGSPANAKPVQLSEYDLFYQIMFSGVFNTNPVMVCANALWPSYLMPPSSNYNAQQAFIRTKPPANAIADRVNHQATTVVQVYPSSLADFTTQAQTYISSGFPLCVFYPPDHQVVAWGYDANGFIGFDSRTTRPGAYNGGNLSYASAYSAFWFSATTEVLFNPPPAGGYQSMTVTNPPSTLPTVTGNNASGTIQETYVYSGDANNAPSTATRTTTLTATPPPPPPPPPGTINAVGQSVTDANGNVWLALGNAGGGYGGFYLTVNGKPASPTSIYDNGVKLLNCYGIAGSYGSNPATGTVVSALMASTGWTKTWNGSTF